MYIIYNIYRFTVINGHNNNNYCYYLTLTDKYLLALRSLIRAHNIDKENPHLYKNIVLFNSKGKNKIYSEPYCFRCCCIIYYIIPFSQKHITYLSNMDFTYVNSIGRHENQ